MIDERKRRHFSLFEFCIVMVVIAVLAAVLSPVFASAKQNSKDSICMQNAKRLALAILRYTADNNGGFPYGGVNNAYPHLLLRPPRGAGGKYASWTGCIQCYAGSSKLPLFCPYWKDSEEAKRWPNTIDTSYWYFCAHNCPYVPKECALCGYRISDIRILSKKPCLTELNIPHMVFSGTADNLTQSHAFCDGHVEIVRGSWKEIYTKTNIARDGVYQQQ